MSSDDEDAMSTKMILESVFKIVLGLCQYYLPMTASVLWAFFGIAAFLTDSMYLQYLYTTHLFIDGYVTVLLSKLHEEISGGTCIATGCYCTEGQNLSTFFWVVFVIWMEFGMWPPPLFKSVVLCTAFVTYALSLPVSGLCTMGSTALSIVVGAGLGIIKIYMYIAIYSTLVNLFAQRAILKAKIAKTQINTHHS